jgi:hypothetical protein
MQRMEGAWHRQSPGERALVFDFHGVNGVTVLNFRCVLTCDGAWPKAFIRVMAQPWHPVSWVQVSHFNHSANCPDPTWLDASAFQSEGLGFSRFGGSHSIC